MYTKINVCRAGGRVQHVQILPTVVMGVKGYTFGNVFSPVVYKIVHYYMENLIQGSTVLKYPMGNVNVSLILCASLTRCNFVMA